MPIRSRLARSLVALGVAGLVAVTASGCDQPAQVARHNVSLRADSFEVVRRLVVLNTRSHEPMFEMTGNFAIEREDERNALVITEKVAADDFRVHFVRLSHETFYVVEDIGGTDINPFRREIRFIPEQIVPTISVDGSWTR